MSNITSIEWTDRTWQVTRGCERVSPGCGGARGVGGCYAEKIAGRFSGEGRPFHGFAVMTPQGARWTGKVEPLPANLAEPLRWRTPQRIFVNSMSDLFHEDVPFEFVAAVFGVMAACRRHTFQILTKRPARMRAFFAWVGARAPAEQAAWIAEVAAAEMKCGEALGTRGASRVPGECLVVRHAIDTFLPKHGITSVTTAWPLPNVWLGVSVEDQRRADERIPELLRVPAAVRFLSCEPLLGPVDLHISAPGDRWWTDDAVMGGLGWVIVGGESGHGARPFDLAWARSIVEQCKGAPIPVFVKQLGARPESDRADDQRTAEARNEAARLLVDVPACTFPIIGLKSKKGGSMEEWPEDLRVREWPEARR